MLGVETGNEGVVVYSPYRTLRLKWSDVAGFETRRWAFNQEIGIRLKDGERIRTSLVQGRVVRWKEGKTKDIMSVLRAELTERGAGASA
jgi:hypothetical protein